MSQENVDRLLEATEAFNGFAADSDSDVSGLLRYMDPEIQFEPVQAIWRDAT